MLLKSNLSCTKVEIITTSHCQPEMSYGHFSTKEDLSGHDYTIGTLDACADMGQL